MYFEILVGGFLALHSRCYACDMDYFARTLALTDRQIVEGIALVVKQREIIMELRRRGLDASESQSRLSTFLKTLREYVQYRDKMLRDLDTSNASAAPPT